MINVLKSLRRYWTARICYRELQEMYPNGALDVRELHMYSGIPTIHVERGLAELLRLGLAEKQVTGYFLINKDPRGAKMPGDEPKTNGKVYQLTDPTAPAPKKKRRGKNPEIEQTDNNHATFIMMWTTAYELKFGKKYIFNSKDAKAAKMALDSKMTPDELMTMATTAWDIGEKKPYIYVCRNSIDLMNFATSLNKLQAELAAQQQKQVVAAVLPVPAAPLEPVLVLPGHKYSYTRDIGPAVEDWTGHPEAQSEYQMAERTWRQWRQTQK